MSVQIKIPKKLIEVALPLDDINIASAYEKMPGIGPHPRGLHLWWARRPLAAGRAIIFAQMVNDPGYERELGRGVNKVEAERKREVLFDILRDLVKWENFNNEEVLERARTAIRESWLETCELNKNHPDASTLFNPNELPGFHDPFAGGGALPLAAQQLGLKSFATDLNPVAVTINKAMIEIPPRFANQEPIGPVSGGEAGKPAGWEWKGLSGLSEDVRRYAAWIQSELKKRIGEYYPQVDIKTGMPSSGSREETIGNVVAWIWARTVKSPNPAFSDCDVPLISSFVLANKKSGNSFLHPVIDGKKYSFEIKHGPITDIAKLGTTAGKRKAFKCLISGSPIDYDYIRSEGKAGRIGVKLIAVVAELERGKIYLPATVQMENVAVSCNPSWIPEMELPDNPRDFKTPNYGMSKFGQIFTKRQLVALNEISGLILEAKEKICNDFRNVGMKSGEPLSEGGKDGLAYADALCLYLSFGLDRTADFNNAVTRWVPSNEKVMNLFGKQAIAMTWDFPEANIIHDTVGGFYTCVSFISQCIEKLTFNALPGIAMQADAQTQTVSVNKVISTDPPYYDNIGYADLSDFFYVWMRKTLRPIFPVLFGTMAVPKSEELVATPYRHGTKDSAESFFLNGMTEAMSSLSRQAHPAFPVTIYYAFKQSETNDGSTSSTGWETFIDAVLRAGFSIEGTWPLRSEQEFRMIGMGANALASSIVLVCQKRPETATSISRREFLDELSETMPLALEAMIGGTIGQSPIAPVDLAQAAIGPGMAVFSKYAAVLNQDGSHMSVHDALVLINKAITEYLNPESGNFDADTLFCSSWFDQYGWSTEAFGEADTLARAKGTSVATVQHAGVIESGGGKVRLVKWAEYPTDWDPKKDNHTPVWEACHHLVRTLLNSGESASGELLARMPERGEAIRQLAYHLYTLCERKGWAEDARAYNSLITSWHQIVTASIDVGHVNEQMSMEL